MGEQSGEKSARMIKSRPGRSAQGGSHNTLPETDARVILQMDRTPANPYGIRLRKRTSHLIPSLSPVETGRTASTIFSILLPREKIGKMRVEKETGNTRRMMAQNTHKNPNFGGDVLRSKGQLARMDRTLQSMIQIFIRIVFRSIGRHEKQLILVIPCRDQARFWKKSNIEPHEKIKVLADEVICLSERYYNGCMQYRNRFLIDNSSARICYLTQPKGGTAYTVTYARNKGLSVFNLAQRKMA